MLLLSQVLGGPASYDGRALGEAHRGLGVTEADYDKVVAHLVSVLVELGADDEAIAAAGAVVAGVKPDIVGSGRRRLVGGDRRRRLKTAGARSAAHGDQVPLFFYSTLFLTNPDIRDMFPVSMAAQRDKLVAALGRVISRVDDLDSVVPTLQQLGRDHRRFAVVPDHYPAVGDALLATLEHFSGAEWTDELARDWAAAYGIVADVMIARGRRGRGRHAAVVGGSRSPRSSGARSAWRCSPSSPQGPLPYRAGQSVAIESPLRPRLWRYYTPATLPGDDGALRAARPARARRPGQHGARAGAPRWATCCGLGCPRRRRGSPSTPRRAATCVLLAGGTGVGAHEGAARTSSSARVIRRVHLFWGARYHRELYDLPALRRLAAHTSGLRLVPCVSDEPGYGAACRGAAPSSRWRCATATGPTTRSTSAARPRWCGAPSTPCDGRRPRRPPVHVEEFGHKETSP